MGAAEHRAAPITEVQREALAELIQATGLVRRAGVNLNQAMARLHDIDGLLNRAVAAREKRS